MELKFILLVAVFFLMGVVIFLVATRVRRRKPKVDELNEKIEELERSVDSLTAANVRSSRVEKKVADAVKSLSVNFSHDEVFSHIIRIVKEIIPAECIGLYMYERGLGCLKLKASLGAMTGFKRTYLLGDGVVGTSAKISKVLVTNRERLADPGSVGDRCDMPYFVDICAPILFNDELLGVVCIGEIKDSDGTEAKLLTMVSSLAGVLLRNAVNLDDALQEAHTDPLTGLYNRRYFLKRATEELVRAKGYDYPLSLFMFDIDNFKDYNDINGHTGGDNLLVALGELVMKVTRKTSVVARYGGEEFVVVLPNIDKENARLYAERVRQLTESHPFPNKERQPKGFVSISGGVASYPPDGDTLESLIRVADEALYSAKRNGKNIITG